MALLSPTCSLLLFVHEVYNSCHDSLIRPIALYSCEFWLPNILTKKNFSSKEALLRSWESLEFKVLNQKLCRLLLSVHKRCSRLAALGELGRYPSFIFALKKCLKYEWSLQNCDKDSLIGKAMREMANKPYLGVISKTKMTATAVYGRAESRNL